MNETVLLIGLEGVAISLMDDRECAISAISFTDDRISFTDDII